MPKIVSKTFSKHLADQFIESISEPANNVYYLAASKHTAYSSGDDSVPTPVETTKQFQIDPYNEIIFGKKITSSDVSLMIPRYNWTSGTVYDQYSDTDEYLFTKQFYVVASTGSYYYVYKVLDNNNGSASTVSPISNTDESASFFITTGDGYKWKLMYRVSQDTFNKFSTSNYMPVQTSSNVSLNAVSGAIDVIEVVSPGSNYIATLTGTFTADDITTAIPGGLGSATSYRLTSSASTSSDFYINSALYISSGTGSGQIRKIVSYEAASRILTVDSAFTIKPTAGSQYVVSPYVLITGDGTNATAYASIASNSTVSNYVSSVVVVNRGSKYTYAGATVTGNTGGVSVNTSIIPVIPPIGGHGFKAPQELGSDAMCISVQFSNTESGFITTSNDYRQIMILKDPLFDSVNMTLASETGSFSTGESIYQFTYATLQGSVATDATSNNINGFDTDFQNALQPGDYVYLYDTISTSKSLRVVDTVSNSTRIALTSNPSFTRANTSATSGYVKIAKATVLATGVKSGNSSPYITLSNAEPKFTTNKTIIGLTTGYIANVTAISVNEKNYNSWSTFDNRTRISYTANTQKFANDSVVYQACTALSNAFFHSANSTYLFLTADKGPINADPASILLQANGSASYTLGSIKITPDIIKNSGEIMYIENYEPVTRSTTQSEAFRVVLKF